MSNMDSFIPFAFAEVNAPLIAPMLTDEGRDHLLTWKAYLKRMRPVPYDVMRMALGSFNAAVAGANLVITNIKVEELTMDKVGDLLWDQLDESAQREWLLKAI